MKQWSNMYGIACAKGASKKVLQNDNKLYG